MNYFTTTDRRLEQFLYAHFIPFHHQSKDQRGHTVWHYQTSPRFVLVLNEYKKLCKKYANKKEA